MILSNYIHNLDPVLLELPGGFALRWYGLAYLLGFIAAWFLLKVLSRRGLWPVAEAKVADFVCYAAIFGVMLGGRLGYVFFYMLPSHPDGFAHLIKEPLVLFEVWKGGMSAHGGILGLFFYTLWYAWRHKLNFAFLGDGLCVVAPLGLLFGRIANFINGELYGRVTDSAAGMYFPAEILDNSAVYNKVMFKVAQNDPALMERMQSVCSTPYEAGQFLIAQARENPQLSQLLAGELSLRHASQLYEGLSEGLLLFVVLWLLRTRVTKLADGVCCGVFFIGYALARIIVEQFREPDSPLVGAMTRGQFLSLFLFLIGFGFLAYAFKKRHSSALPSRQD